MIRAVLRFVSVAIVLATVDRIEAAPSVTLLRPATSWDTAEFRIEGIGDTKNPFDPTEIAIDASFTAPSGRVTTAPAFWYQDYERTLSNQREILTPSGNPEWRLRFTAVEAGEYRVELAITRRNVEPMHATARFSVSAAKADSPRGWVGIGPDKRGFATSDGRPLRLSGENVCWPQAAGTFDYDHWFESMQRVGENVARLWLCPWWAPLEHVPGTLNRYRLDAGWQIDQVFRAAEAHGIYLVLCFDHHGMYQRENSDGETGNNYWKTNPYNVVNGGPCATPNDFFANAGARELYQKRLRYLVGRYGSSPRLLAWEFLNEIDNVYRDLQADDVAAWHRAMGQWLHAHDPYGHLVTTSLTGGSDRPEIWEIPELDFAVYHSYGDAAPARTLADVARKDTARYGKPLWIGEFGTSARGWEIAGDPLLRGLRQGLWGGAVGGSVGTSAPWWWADIHAGNAHGFWKALNEIVARAGLNEGAWSPLDFAPLGEAPTTVEPPAPDAKEFDAILPVGGQWGARQSNVVAIADALGASRAGDALNHYLNPESKHRPIGPMRLDACFGAEAKLVVDIGNVSSDGELVISVDGRELARTPVPEIAKSGQEQTKSREFTFDLPAGHHAIGIANAGKDWMYVDRLELKRVRESRLAAGWRYRPEAIGLFRDRRAIVYVVSPWTTWPANVGLAQPPAISDGSVRVPHWAAGEYTVAWYDPATGKAVGTTAANRDGGALVLPLPAFNDDLAGIVMPTN